VLKRAKYEDGLGDPREVAYAIFGDKCVFTGTALAHGGSTINFAEEIIKSICRTERISPVVMRFFDLQTQRMYGQWRTKPKPGDFNFDELRFTVEWGKEVAVYGWSPVLCPQVVMDQFREFLGTPAQQYETRSDPLDVVQF